jgi:hypothetical protein
MMKGFPYSFTSKFSFLRSLEYLFGESSQAYPTNQIRLGYFHMAIHTQRTRHPQRNRGIQTWGFVFLAMQTISRRLKLYWAAQAAFHHIGRHRPLWEQRTEISIHQGILLFALRPRRCGIWNYRHWNIAFHWKTVRCYYFPVFCHLVQERESVGEREKERER